MNKNPLFKRIGISELKLDLDNPRLPKSKQGKDEASVIEFMLLEAATEELMIAISENGFFDGELLLVVPDKKETGKFIVVEGNRRLTAVKLLNNPDLAKVKKATIKEIVNSAKEKPNVLPCLVFSEKDEILKYLGFRHITGIKSWRLLEKARYLHQLYESEYKDSMTFQNSCVEIAKVIGSRRDYVKRLLIGFDLYKLVEDEKFYKIDNLDDTRFFLNYFTDSLNKDNIRSFIGIDINSDNPLENIKNDNLKKIVHWWFEKTQGQSRVLGDSEGLKLLDSVLGNELAFEAFDKKAATIYQAYEMTDDIDIQFENKIKVALKNLEQADSISVKINEFYIDVLDDLRAIRKIALKIKEFKDSIEDNVEF